MNKPIFNEFSLEGKNALITGAAKTSGLCYGMAKALHEAGAKIVLIDLSDEVFPLAKSLGGAENHCYAVKADLSKMDSLQEGFDKATELLNGKLNILINGAGIQYRCEATDFPVDKWLQVININLSAVFFMCQLAAKIMIPLGGGKIINIASMTSFCASKHIPAYTASKGGIMQLTKALSNEWCGQGINVNAIAPGYMVTDFWAGKINTEQGKAHTARIPAGRWGKPEDLRGVTVFLASAASDYVSGAIIPVDGGYLGA